MKVFISWSGVRSFAVAEELGPWLKKVIQSVDYWISSDMERGVKWLGEIGKSLDAHSIGILCVTPDNVSAPWLNFEAGALSKQFDDGGRVIPYLLDFRSPSDLKEPLGQFNASLADQDGTWAVIKTLNNHSENKQSDADLRETFDVWWPKLQIKLGEIKASVKTQPPARRNVEDKVDDILALLREERLASTPPAQDIALRTAAFLRAGANGDIRSLGQPLVPGLPKPAVRIVPAQPIELSPDALVADRFMLETIRRIHLEGYFLGRSWNSDTELNLVFSDQTPRGLLSELTGRFVQKFHFLNLVVQRVVTHSVRTEISQNTREPIPKSEQ